MSEDLLFYAQLGRVDDIARLVAEGVNPDWAREDGVTTLMMAAMPGRVEVMRSLLDSGATIDLQAPDGTSALLAACAFARTSRDIAGVELLLSRGAQPKLAKAEGNDALMLAARHGLAEAVIALLKSGADPRRKNRYGTTALMQAARGHLVETVRLLLRAGADRSATDEGGLTAKRYAWELGPPPSELVALLAPSDFGSLELSRSDGARQLSRFERPSFKMTLLGSWNESGTGDSLELLEVTGERQILVDVTHLPAELDPEEQKEALALKVRELTARAREDAPGCHVSEVRIVEANHTTQARWTVAFDEANACDLAVASSHGDPCGQTRTSTSPAFFVAVCIYATRARFVTLSYRDFRPNLSDETRGRQAGESVASFRVK